MLSKHQKKRKTRKTKTKTHPERCLSLFTANAAGLKLKTQTLKNELNYSECGIFTLQETHYRKKGKLSIENWEIFDSIGSKASGGSMLGAQKALNPILVEEYNEEFELLVVEANINDLEVRIITGYGPQESWSLEDRFPFFQALEEEIAKAGFAGKSIIISLDANSKLGSDNIPNDTHKQSPNGKLFAGIINRHALIVINGLKGKSHGVITRKRTTIDGEEKSTIDIVVVSSDLIEEVQSVTTDESKEHCLTSIIKTKKGVKVTQSDHNTIITKFSMKWHMKNKSQKTNLFNLKNVEGQNKFLELTSKTGILSNIFKDKNFDIEKATN